MLIKSTITAFFSWAMLPVYVWQGIRVRMRIERMLPARVPTTGLIEGNSPEVRLLVIGDSTVASVGMEKLDDTMGFSIARAVHERTGGPVLWRTVGANSATAGDLRDHIVPHIEPRDWTDVVISVGINDMKNFHVVGRFKRNFGSLIYAVRTRFPNARVIWCPIPDMRQCPALPDQLGRVLAARAELINEMGARMCQERGAIVTDPVHIDTDDAFARDGFHPNGNGYRIWGDHFARWIAPEAAEPAPETVTDEPEADDDPAASDVTPFRRSA